MQIMNWNYYPIDSSSRMNEFQWTSRLVDVIFRFKQKQEVDDRNQIGEDIAMELLYSIKTSTENWKPKVINMA